MNTPILKISLALSLLASSACADTVIIKPGKYANLGKDGDTLQFEGEHAVRVPIVIPSHRTITASEGAVLRGIGNHALLLKNVSDVTIKGVTARDRFLKIENGKDISVLDCTITDMNEHGQDNHAIFIAGLVGGTIERNFFKDITFDHCIMSFSIEQTKIRYNKFINCHEGIHNISFVDGAKGVEISHNISWGMRRMFIEMQEAPEHTKPGYDGLLIEGNWYADPREVNNETFAYSIVSDKGTNTIIRDNYARGPATYPGLVYGFEVAGVNTLVENNRVDGGWVGICLQRTDGATVRGNKLWGTKKASIEKNNQVNSTIGTNDVRDKVPSDAPPRQPTTREAE